MRVPFFCVLAWTLACSVSADQLKEIVIPDHPSAAEQHAAGELSANIALMTGHRVAVVRESKAVETDEGRKILVGRTRRNLEHHAPDSWPADTSVIDEMQELLDRAKGESSDPAVQLRLKLAQVSLNTFIITQIQNTPPANIAPKRFAQYRSLPAETLAMIQEMNLPYPMAATGPFIDQLKTSGYQPPFDALRGIQRLALPALWRFRTDPEDKGKLQDWPTSAETNKKPWRDIRIDSFWTSQGIRYHGVAWYATNFTVPKNVKEELWLLFDMLDGAAEIWIDGTLVGSTPASPWDKPKAVDLTSWLPQVQIIDSRCASSRIRMPQASTDVYG